MYSYLDHNQTNQPNQPNQTNQNNQINQPSKATHQSNQPNQPNQPKQAANQTNQPTNQTNPTACRQHLKNKKHFSVQPGGQHQKMVFLHIETSSIDKKSFLCVEASLAPAGPQSAPTGPRRDPGQPRLSHGAASAQPWCSLGTAPC